MRIKWYGTASIMIESGDRKILFDPYLKSLNPSLPPVPANELALADACFITHPHLDHFADIDLFLQAGLKEVFVGEQGFKTAQRRGISTENFRPLAEGIYEVGGITVRAYPSRHCKFNLGKILGVLFSPRTYKKIKNAARLVKQNKKFPLGKRSIFAFEICAEGKKIFLLGSAGMAKDVSYPSGCDLLVFPYQGRTGMDKYMLKFLRKFQPKAVFADHFDDAFPPATKQENTQRFVAAVKKYSPKVRAIVPKENEWFEV